MAALLLACIAGTAVYLALRPRPTREESKLSEAAANSPPTAPAQAAAGQKSSPAANGTSLSAVVPGADLASTEASSSNAHDNLATPVTTELADLSPSTVLENMRTAIRQYGSMFEGNPVGNNPEITRALDGENPKQAKFVQPESGLRINPKGELIDSWGTPFFFHQLSGTEMEIRSAGPDRKMWTADDLVIK